MDYSLPHSSVRGILPAGILEWVAMPSSKGSSWPMDWTHVSYVSCIGSQVFIINAIWEAQIDLYHFTKSLNVMINSTILFRNHGM